MPTLMVLIVLGGLCCLVPTLRRQSYLQVQDAELSRRIAEKQREIAELADHQRRFNTDADFVEHIARQNHRVYPGEVIFIFDKPK